MGIVKYFHSFHNFLLFLIVVRVQSIFRVVLFNIISIQLAVLTGKRKKATKRETDDTSSCCKPKIVNNEEIAQYEKSKIMLQAKAKLYDKMSSGEVEGMQVFIYAL